MVNYLQLATSYHFPKLLFLIHDYDNMFVECNFNLLHQLDVHVYPSRVQIW